MRLYVLPTHMHEASNKNMTKGELITRIKKLLALSDSSNPNEAAIALSRAQKLMQQYHIEMSELEDSVISERVIETVRGMKNIKHISQIGHILTKVLGVEFIYHTNQYGTVNKVNMIGPKDSLESCEYIFVIYIKSEWCGWEWGKLRFTEGWGCVVY